MKTIPVSSSSVHSLAYGPDAIEITFHSNALRTYTYKPNPEFDKGLDEVIEKDLSVGRFINYALKNDLLVPAQ